MSRTRRKASPYQNYLVEAGVWYKFEEDRRFGKKPFKKDRRKAQRSSNRVKARSALSQGKEPFEVHKETH